MNWGTKSLWFNNIACFLLTALLVYLPTWQLSFLRLNRDKLENEDIKDQVMAAISEVARPDVVIASSTSGIVPTRLQARCKNPERMIVGHPFNPVYLIPLVEVVGGKKTASEAIRWTMDFYKYWGKDPLHCRTEKPKHIGNRLQAALFSEMLHLVAEGAATTAELDAALSSGPGLRWALMGSNLTYHLGSGDSGIGPLVKGYHLNPLRPEIAPPLANESLIKKMVDGTRSQADQKLIAHLLHFFGASACGL